MTKAKISDAQLEACCRDMAMTFEIPAKQILQMHAANAGVTVTAFRMTLEAYRNRGSMDAQNSAEWRREVQSHMLR